MDKGTVKTICVGIGGCGCRNVDLINKLYNADEYILLDTDLKSLQKNMNETKQYMPFTRQISGHIIGENSFSGMGVNTYEEGQQATIESKQTIMAMLQGANIVFVMAGLGGTTGTCAMPIIASYAKAMGAIIIGVVTMPFKFEGEKRRRNADESLEKLKQYADKVVVFENENIFKRELSAKASEALKLRYADYEETFHKAFE